MDIKTPMNCRRACENRGSDYTAPRQRSYSAVSLNGLKSFLFTVILSFGLGAPPGSFAHNVGDVESSLLESERYMQPVSKEAPRFLLQDPDGNMFSLEDFRGRVVILNFLYSKCKEECPLHSLKIAEVQGQIAEAFLSDQVQFLSIATDTEPSSSTAGSMRDHGEKFGLNPSNWKFLFGGVGGERMGLALAEAYGLKFVPTGTGEQMHGVVTFVIDPQGWLRAKFHGLKFDTTNLTVFAAALAHGDHGGQPSTASAGVPARPASATSVIKSSDWILAFVGIGSLLLLAWVGHGYFRERAKTAQHENAERPYS